jgi:hypothetical protein
MDKPDSLSEYMDRQNMTRQLQRFKKVWTFFVAIRFVSHDAKLFRLFSDTQLNRLPRAS